MVSLLDIIGPVMVGPSSSHTAGACRIGLLARALAGGMPDRAKVELHGSFARTGVGHGTDRAIAGGLLGFQPDDERLRRSLELADEAGLAITFANAKLRGNHHPNTTRITVARGDRTLSVTGSSLGAGRISITDIDGYPVDITGALPTLVFVAPDVPGIVATVTSALAGEQANIATMRVSRRRKGGEAIHIYELDAPPSEGALEAIRGLGARMVRAVPRVS
ncbi:MAG TPA: L-serine ammonia-lyase, iron-sulfur-dependent subunit beta [Gemmatimonadales bacterium]|nr:L-serine ammonia-lyase, iron-sulfur-dependent subunit beta [Gemmatimonadales bacterium]